MRENNSGIWIVGCGDIGRRVARLYQIAGTQTRATARSKDSVSLARQLGIDAFLLDLDDTSTKVVDIVEAMMDASVFYFVAPQPDGRLDLRLQQFLRLVGDRVKRIVMISTTGIYGNCHGQWVDEASPVRPQADRAYRRLDAELQLQQWAKQENREYVILRVPGIYALDRLPLARLKKGLPVVRKQEAPWTNRIHADDLAMVCQRAMQSQKATGEIFNVTDSHPSTMTDYFNKVADYADLPRPPQISLKKAEQQLSAGMMSYMRESRRISNRKLLEMLDITLSYPSLDECLKK